MRQNIIAGNWKMNGNIAETKELVEGLLTGQWDPRRCQAVICPPYTSLSTAGKLLHESHIALGAQDMSVHASGAYTAEISADMLLTVGVTFVILGHSERRQYHAETDKLVNAKANVAFEAGLTPIICVGETLEQREAGQVHEVVGAQINGTLSEFSADLMRRSVIAYEPVWAIGTGKTATPEIAEDVHRFIRQKVAELDADAAEMIGALVGGASLKADDFLAIINAV